MAEASGNPFLCRNEEGLRTIGRKYPVRILRLQGIRAQSQHGCHAYRRFRYGRRLESTSCNDVMLQRTIAAARLPAASAGMAGYLIARITFGEPRCGKHAVPCRIQSLRHFAAAGFAAGMFSVSGQFTDALGGTFQGSPARHDRHGHAASENAGNPKPDYFPWSGYLSIKLWHFLVRGDRFRCGIGKPKAELDHGYIAVHFPRSVQFFGKPLQSAGKLDCGLFVPARSASGRRTQSGRGRGTGFRF